MIFNKEQEYWASVLSNNEFLCVETYSGDGMVGRDLAFTSHFLHPQASNREIGDAILIALSNSRVLTDDEYKLYFHPERNKVEYSSWKAMLKNKYRYKSERAVFKDMRRCMVCAFNRDIQISPTRHEKLEAWGGTGNGGRDRVILPVDSEPEQIGAGLRLALSRCI